MSDKDLYIFSAVIVAILIRAFYVIYIVNYEMDGRGSFMVENNGSAVDKNMLQELENSVTKENSVLQSWVNDKCDFKAQTGLISALRGSDLLKGKDNDAKNVTKMLRYIILNDADKKTSFMSAKVVPANIVKSTLVNRYYDNPHWVDHIVLAAHIISKQHPHNYTRAYWGSLNYMMRDELKKKREVVKIVSKYEELYQKGGC